jgi:uncharacterized protein (TIGR00297 family)
VLTGVLLAIAVAAIAHRGRMLSRSGAVVAVVVATLCVAGGWSWALLLIAFFMSGSWLSRLREGEKRVRTGDVVEKGGARDAWQVLANGGVFAACALGAAVAPASGWEVAGAAAIAASTADTWATEIGTLSTFAPRSIVSWKKVEAGTSGGITVHGIVAVIGGALFVAILARLLGWSSLASWAAIVGGFAGSLVDSLLGATLQGRRWCPTCGRGTERAVHSCGTVTSPSGGIRWLNNDVVNALSSLCGALIGYVMFVRS